MVNCYSTYLSIFLVFMLADGLRLKSEPQVKIDEKAHNAYLGHLGDAIQTFKPISDLTQWFYDKLNFHAGCRMSTDWPTNCPQGNDHWSVDELKMAMPEFAKLYAKRPIQNNRGGMNINHAFALWFTVSHMKPEYIIESGVLHGQTTWLLHQAAPEAQVYSVDPMSEWQLLYKDNSTKQRYFMGENFKDLSNITWDDFIPKDARHRTLVMLDDHQSSIKRTKQLLAHDFIHLWYDDNWSGNYEGADCYSFNQVCSPAPAKAKAVSWKDNMGASSESISVDDHNDNSKWLSSHIEIYYEFPAIFDGCADHSSHKHSHSLFSKEAELLAMGLPSIADERNHYLHLYSPYVKLKPSL